MKKRKGFTLIELLVVIAIIALLMSVLMPAMARVRAQAKSSACLSQLHSWALIFKLYADDFGGVLGDGNWTGTGGYWRIAPPTDIGPKRGYREWVHYLRPYYDNDYRLTTCPMATKPWSEGGRGKNSAWGIFPGVSAWGGVLENWNSHAAGYAVAVGLGAWGAEAPGDRGSYGMNNWCVGLPEDGMPAGANPLLATGRPIAGGWRTINVKKAGSIPLLADALWIHGSPTPGDMPSPIELGVTRAQSSANNMDRFLVNRHNGYINAAFLDFSARQVGLKELWLLKWSRTYLVDSTVPDKYGNLGAIQTIQGLGAWPPWMARFKEYFDLVPQQ